ncbi:MAG: hypothetical protein EOP11_10310, partial [Proteobacteria bacterium]
MGHFQRKLSHLPRVASAVSISIYLLLALYGFSPALAAEELYLDGPPRIGLADGTYLPMQAFRLKGARTVWINKDYFRARGIDVDTKAGQAKLNRLMEKEFGYLVPNKSVPKNLLSSESKTFYPDGYGGPGLNGNYGGARAASVADYQLKGLGPTTMLGAFADADHSSGGVGAAQAMAEAIWSVILNRESPDGSNQVVALLDTGLYEPLAKGISQPRFLVVREDPLRPAHFIANPSKKDEARTAIDAKRVSENLDRLKNGKVINADLTKPGAADEMLSTFADRVSAQWAYMHANLIHHGAVSPSNIDIRGPVLDLSSVSTLPGAMPAMAHDPLPFGDIKTVEKYLLKPFYDAIQESGQIPLSIDLETLQKKAEDAYNMHYRHELLRIAGMPDETAVTAADGPAGRQLVKLLDELRTTGYGERLKTKAAVPEIKGTFDSMAIIRLLGKAPGKAPDARALNKLLKGATPEEAARLSKEITAKFGAFYEELFEDGALRGMSQSAMEEAIARRTADLARDRKALRRNIMSYLKKGVGAIGSRVGFYDMQAGIDKVIEQNTMREHLTRRRQPAFRSVPS